MNKSLSLVLEHPIEGIEAVSGTALVRVIEAHEALVPLLDFTSVDPTEIAIEVGMTYEYDPEDVNDLEEIDLGEPEWFEPSAGLNVVRKAIAAVQREPQSIAAAIYDPDLTASEVISDLEAIEQALETAQQHETRFHFRIGTAHK